MKKLFFDYSKLAGKIKEQFGSQKEFASALGVSETTLSCKMNNVYYFSQAEIKNASKLLKLEPGTVSEYFFTLKV